MTHQREPVMGEDAASLTELQMALSRLRIRYPELHDIEEWAVFLPSLLAYCKSGDFQNARIFWGIAEEAFDKFHNEEKRPTE